MADDRIVTLSFDLNRERLLSAFFAEDDVGAIIRCHFEAERAAIHVLAKLTGGRFDPNNRMTQYLGQKLEMLRVLGVPRDRIEPLKFHHVHRNKFAHNGQEEITAAQLNELHGAVLVVVPNFGEMEFRFPDNDAFKARYDSLTTRQKYVGNMMIAITNLASIPDMIRPAATAAPASP